MRLCFAFHNLRDVKVVKGLGLWTVSMISCDQSFSSPTSDSVSG